MDMDGRTPLDRRRFLAASVVAAAASHTHWASAGSTEDLELLRTARAATRGDLPLAAMTFRSTEHWVLDVGRAFYPELGETFPAWNHYDFSSGYAHQRTVTDDGYVDWMVDPQGVTHTLRNGVPHCPPGGIDRGFHLRAFAWFLRPLDAIEPAAVHLQSVGLTRGRPSLRARYRVGHKDVFTLELDPTTRRVRAINYSVMELGIPDVLRVEYGDERLVAPGTWVAHRFAEGVRLGALFMPFHTMVMEDVHVQRRRG
jgi:hypothetical protein